MNPTLCLQNLRNSAVCVVFAKCGTWKLERDRRSSPGTWVSESGCVIMTVAVTVLLTSVRGHCQWHGAVLALVLRVNLA